MAVRLLGDDAEHVEHGEGRHVREPDEHQVSELERALQLAGFVSDRVRQLVVTRRDGGVGGEGGHGGFLHVVVC